MGDFVRLSLAFGLLPGWVQTLVCVYAASLVFLGVALYRSHRYFDRLSAEERRVFDIAHR